MVQIALTSTRSRAANSWNERIRLKAECDRLRQEVLLLREEMRIKDSRMDRIPAQRRPHYPPVERLAILELRAARHWSQAQTAERMQITPATISSWTGRLDEEGPAAPISERHVKSRKPNDIWHVDLTTVPTAFGFWIPWLPGSLPQRWPFCWWVAVALDHYSRRVIGFAVYRQQPTAAKVRSFLDRAIRATRSAPRTLITDQGSQFTNGVFRSWCRRREIGQRFGAVGKCGSIAVIERFNRTLKSEGTRLLLVPLRFSDFRREVSLFVTWYNGERPHTTLDARTPDEVFFGRRPAATRARFETRASWPPASGCAAPAARVRGKPGAKVDLSVQFQAGRKHLPVVTLRRAA